MLNTTITVNSVPLNVHYRENTSDMRVLEEVLIKQAYNKPKFKFDIQKDEQWLDLGANIGAFALYCQARGATAICYEPEPGCFEILQKNAPNFECHQTAVTALSVERVPFFVNMAARWGSSGSSHHRGSVYSGKMFKAHSSETLPNKHAAFLSTLTVNGLKMDIEGSEFEIIDKEYLPTCQKMVLEYHLSHDTNLSHLRARLEILKKRFSQVRYSGTLDRMLQSNSEDVKDYLQERFGYVWIMDPLIFCLA